MKNNYPIKYGVIPIKEKNSRDYEEIVCYIVSKVYVVSQELRYDKDGKDQFVYKIVPPYRHYEFNNYERIEPVKMANGKFSFYIETNKVFDIKEVAEKEKDYLNSQLIFNKKVHSYSDDKQSALLEEAFNNTVLYYKKLEDLVEENTSDLVVNAPRISQHTIIKKDEVYKETDTSIYDIIYYIKDFDFKAYSLTEKEYDKLLKALKKGKSTEEFENDLLIVNNGINKVALVMDSDNYFYLHKGVIYDDKYDSLMFDINKCNVTYFTTETYDDILKSYPATHNNSIKLERKL